MNAILDEIQRVIPLVWEASGRDEDEDAYALFREVRYLFSDATRALNAMTHDERAKHEQRFLSYHPAYQEMVAFFDVEYQEVNDETY